jgi:hypothetical protein
VTQSRGFTLAQTTLTRARAGARCVYDSGLAGLRDTGHTTLDCHKVPQSYLPQTVRAREGGRA